MKILLLFLFLLFFSQGSQAEQFSFANIRQGEMLPSFCAEELEGRRFCSAELKGRIAVVTFFRLDQKQSVKQMRALQNLQADYQKKGVSVVGILAGKADRQAVVSFRNGNEITFPLLLDSGGAVSRLFGVFAEPSTGLFSADGKLTFFTASNWVGFTPSVETHVRLLLKEISRAELDTALESPANPDRSAVPQAGAQYNLARILFDKNELDKARKTLDSLLARHPHHAPSHLLSGRIALQEKDYEAALLHFEHALKLDPGLDEAKKGRQTCLDNL